MSALRRYLLAGLLFWLPIWITLLLVKFVLELTDKSLSLLPVQYQPQSLFGVHIPGFSILIALILLFFTGMLVTNFLGKRLVHFWDTLVAKIPLIRSIYSAIKQVLHTVFSSEGLAFRKVLLIEYPRRGSWSVAFLTGKGLPEARQHEGQDLLTVFVPTTPNPTSGFLIMVPASDAIELDMSVDAALKFVISLGVVQGNSKQPEELALD